MEKKNYEYKMIIGENTTTLISYFCLHLLIITQSTSTVNCFNSYLPFSVASLVIEISLYVSIPID